MVVKSFAELFGKRACMFKLVISIFALLLVSCFTDPEGTITILRQKGYTDVQITGYRPFSCWKNEQATGFIAKNPSGHYVKGCACKNIFTGTRIKVDK